VPRTVHIIGNGDSSVLYHEEQRKGLKLTCNLAPFEIPDAYAACIVDFKMMHTINTGIIDVPGEWILGARPKMYMEKHPNFYTKRARQIKQFYTKLPKYAANYTDFNCGHMATYFALEHLKAEVIHMYGFDSIFDFNLRSSTDLFITSDRGSMNNNRLTNNWRPLFNNMFKDFNETKINLHHFHSALKFEVPSNVEVHSYKKRGEIVDAGKQSGSIKTVDFRE